jgi:predicted PilT family ATPase
MTLASRLAHGEEQQFVRVVVDLEDCLRQWLQTANKNDAIRIISGGPGSGKSSFAKIFAAHHAATG